MKFRYFLILIIILSVLIWPDFLFEEKEIIPTPAVVKTEVDVKDDKVVEIDLNKKLEATNTVKKDMEDKNELVKDSDNIEKSKSVLLDVPFTPQAPFADWSDPRFQDGCEEASVLMAMHWVKNEKLTREDAKKEIIAMAEWEKKSYGDFRDTSARDTADRLLGGYYKYSNFDVKENISADDIIDEIDEGNLVIAPMNGQALKNPYYRPPGPERHMLVIRGYDPATEEFITNDAGTKRGELYRYKKDVLFDAIRDYASGYHIPIKQIDKVMIVVTK
jgi:hypothetical protein